MAEKNNKQEKTKEKKITPAMAQYYEMKQAYPDSILFFRMGDFYEMFDDDAHIAHKVLWINITTRNKNAENPTPLAGIPFHAREKYLPILVKAGYKVAIAEQVSDPTLKWIVKRDVVRIVTPATLSLEWDEYSSWEESNIVVAIIKDKKWYGISYCDITSGAWKTGEFRNFDDLATALYKMSPKEVILDKNLFWDEQIKEVLSKKFSLNIYYFEFRGNSKKKLIKHFDTKNLEGFYLEDKALAQSSSALLLDYLETNQKASLDFLNSISYESFDEFMWIDENTIRNLDLIYNMATKSNTVWTLFWVLNNTKTSMWARMLREQVIKPLQDIDAINTRLNIIEEFLKDVILLSKVRDKLKLVSDIDLILNRLALWRAMPKDLLNLKKSLETVLEVFDLVKKSGNKKLIKLLEIE